MAEDAPTVARKCWRTCEPYHSVVYFAPEAAEEYAAIGLEGQSGYFASRAAPMGPVTAEAVVATFFNFRPALVRDAMDGVWEKVTPEQVLGARARGADRALRRTVGEDVDSEAMADAAALARRAAEAACERPEGRPLFAGHARLPWPHDPHLDLWHSVTLLREFRGDGHVATLLAEGLQGCEALVVHAATGEVPVPVLTATRAWPEDEWGAALESLRSRGWIDGDGDLTDAGREHRAMVERRTDELAAPAWGVLTEDEASRLRTIVRPWSRAIVDSDLRFG